MENSNIDINEIKDKLVKVAEDFSKEYDDILRQNTIPIQTYEIYVEPPKRESNPDKQ